MHSRLTLLKQHNIITITLYSLHLSFYSRTTLLCYHLSFLKPSVVWLHLSFSNVVFVFFLCTINTNTLYYFHFFCCNTDLLRYSAFLFFFAILVVYVALLCSLYLMNSLDKLMGKRLYFVFHELISWIVICIFYLMNLCEKNISKKNNSIKYIREKPIKIFEPNWLVWFSFNFEKYQKPNQLRVQLFGHWIHQKLI
jgi:hypothetical protein